MKFLPNAFIILSFGGVFFKLRPCPKPCPVPPRAFTHAVPFRARAAIFGTVDHPAWNETSVCTFCMKTLLFEEPEFTVPHDVTYT
jgi:hypothetical protein